jgi:hypothetical protein
MPQIMTESNVRPLEGHFACGSGLLIDSECLGHSYQSRTTGRDLTISLPCMPADWQGDGFLEPPKWKYQTFKDAAAQGDPRLSDSGFEWGATSGFKNNDDGSQSPESARVRRWGFETTMDAVSGKFAFFNARSEAVREIEVWWDLVSSWISIFTRQDFVEIGKTNSGIRVGPIVTWCGSDDQGRVNGSRDASIPIVNDVGVDRLDEATLSRCLALAANGTEPPDEWLFIRDARSLVNAKQYRRAAIDSCTAAELSLTALIDAKLTTDGTCDADRNKLFKSHHGISRLTELHKKVGAAGQLPRRLVEEVGALRNKAAHRGYTPTISETKKSIRTAASVVELAYPIATFGLQIGTPSNRTAPRRWCFLRLR